MCVCVWGGGGGDKGIWRIVRTYEKNQAMPLLVRIVPYSLFGSWEQASANFGGNTDGGCKSTVGINSSGTLPPTLALLQGGLKNDFNN